MSPRMNAPTWSRLITGPGSGLCANGWPTIPRRTGPGCAPTRPSCTRSALSHARADLGPELWRLHPPLVDVVAGRLGLDFLGILALEVEALPGLLGGLRVALEDQVVELGPLLGP